MMEEGKSFSVLSMYFDNKKQSVSQDLMISILEAAEHKARDAILHPRKPVARILTGPDGTPLNSISIEEKIDKIQKDLFLLKMYTKHITETDFSDVIANLNQPTRPIKTTMTIPTLKSAQQNNIKELHKQYLNNKLRLIKEEVDHIHRVKNLLKQHIQELDKEFQLPKNCSRMVYGFSTWTPKSELATLKNQVNEYEKMYTQLAKQLRIMEFRIQDLS